MDSIEKMGGIDPVGVQLQDLCPDGQVTLQNLNICSKCSQIGHSLKNCTFEEVEREHYQKMLQLVVAYRALVKERKRKVYKLKQTNPNALVLKETIEAPKKISPNEIITLDDDDEILQNIPKSSVINTNNIDSNDEDEDINNNQDNYVYEIALIEEVGNDEYDNEKKGILT